MSPKSKPTKPPRRQPQRTCIVCHTTSDKRALVRIVRTAQQGVQIDERGKVPGRGAYLCHQRSCWQTALSGPVLPRALNTVLTDDERQQLTQYADKFVTQQSTHTRNSL
ncbi:MAG: YlxR family protein [Chloroflexota bacterium]